MPTPIHLNRTYEQQNSDPSLRARLVLPVATNELTLGVTLGAFGGLIAGTRLAQGASGSNSEITASVQQNSQPTVEPVVLMGGGTLLGAVAAGVAMIGYAAKFGK